MARSASTYWCVVAGLSCPSHRAITLMSTPDCRRCMAVECLRQCGEIVLPTRLGVVSAAALTANARRCVTLDRVIACPPRLGSSADVGVRSGLNFSQARITLTVDRQSGTD